MNNIKDKAVTYNSNVTAEKLNVLTSLVNTGKNAHVLLTIAKAMMKGNDLPKWALTLTVKHFEELFNLSEKSLSKCCSVDSYHDIRSMVNIHLKDQVITSVMYETLNSILTVKKFQNVEILLTIKAKYEAMQVAKGILSAFASVGAHEVSQNVVVPKAKIDLSALTQTLNDLELDEVRLMMEVLQGRLLGLEPKQAELDKVA